MALVSTPSSKVIIDNGALQRMINDPNGQVVRYLFDVTATRVQVRAIQKAGRDTGKLRNSIVKRVTQDSRGVVILVGSNLFYARMHHDGTQPHRIEAPEGGVLAFEIGGTMIFVKYVDHPGTAPNPFLTDSLREVVQGS